MTTRVVLDSFALLTLFRAETGADKVQRLLEHASENDEPVLMTEVNYAELQYIIRRKNGDAAWQTVSEKMQALPLIFHPATRELADLAAYFKSHYQISLADAFAAALAKKKQVPLMTGDPEFESLKSEIKIQWLIKNT